MKGDACSITMHVADHLNHLVKRILEKRDVFTSYCQFQFLSVDISAFYLFERTNRSNITQQHV